jgi:hypothetical protein
VGAFVVAGVGLPLFIADLVDQPGDKADYVRVRLNGELLPHFLAGEISLEGTTITHPGGQCRLGDLVSRKFLSGVHHVEGIIIAKGPGIRSRHRLPRHYCQVADVVPTALALLGKPVGRDMDGKVLFDLFEDGPGAELTLAYVDTHGAGEQKLPIVGQGTGDAAAGDDMLRDQLRSLGYIN